MKMKINPNLKTFKRPVNIALEAAGIKISDLPVPFQKASPQMPQNMFIINDYSGIAALRYWLQTRKYNTFIETIDANQKPLFGLMWDYELGRFPSTRRSERGLVLVIDRDLAKKTALFILNYMAAETEYGKQWRQAQRQIWEHGRE